MREEPCDMEGTRYVVDKASEVARLPASLAPLVSPQLIALLSDPATTLTRMASRVSFAPLARWLPRMARAARSKSATYHVALYVPSARYIEGQPPEAYFELESPEASPVLITGGFANVPRWCPPSLRQVLRTVGSVKTQYNCAGAILRPSEQRTLLSLHDELEEMWFPPAPEHAVQVPPNAAGYHAFYLKSTGGYVTANRRGVTWNCSYVGGNSPGPALDEFLTSFFRHGPFGPAWRF